MARALDQNGTVSRIVRICVAAASALAAVSCSSSGPTSSGPRPTRSRAVTIDGVVRVPAGQPGVLSVVEIGGLEPDATASTIPVVVRNRSSETVSNVVVHGTARLNGQLVGSADSVGFAPVVLRPGEWGYSFVQFAHHVPDGSTFAATVTGDTQLSALRQVDLRISEIKHQANPVVALLTNPSHTPVKTSTVELWLICFTGLRVSQPYSVHVYRDLALSVPTLARGPGADFSVRLPSGRCRNAYYSAISAHGVPV
jgi:hypothetical protein